MRRKEALKVKPGDRVMVAGRVHVVETIVSWGRPSIPIFFALDSGRLVNHKQAKRVNG